MYYQLSSVLTLFLESTVRYNGQQLLTCDAENSTGTFHDRCILDLKPYNTIICALQQPLMSNSSSVKSALHSFDRPWGDSRYGVQVSISGGRPKKSSLIEKAAKFGREAFGSRSASAGAHCDSRRPSLYTAVKDGSGLRRDGSSLSISSSMSSLALSQAETRNVRGSVASSIYDETETTKSTIPPLRIVKKVPVPQLPPFDLADETTSLTEVSLSKPQHRDLDNPTEANRSSTDSTRTVTQRTIEPSTSHFSWTTYAETERSVSPTTSYIEQIPDSRFSWTTASTATTYRQETPPSSPPRTYPSSIMSRRRPVPGKEAAPPKRHDSMGDVQDLPEAARDKALPQPPKTRHQGDHIDELMSRLESLELQKTNMQKLLKELAKVEMASPIDVSEKMRRENRKKMGEVHTRQDEVQKELFEVGRLLSRARAKAEEAGGSTGLWLRRVTD